ncbi:Gfo/Idh/MocA family protein [Reinekea sp. G2M2-21]|uniref:Gfo/Idh/MocA family protein n=1 Tax=Reinekea sp. G2M2-21 TaxID=2788942 RepID=UPI0018AA1542|nr:Gfo/Idh/MocA family oxidoreductase [Reinekea sp. G2M2-21]
MKAILIGLGNIGLMYDVDKPDCVQTHAKALALIGAEVLTIDPDENRRKLATSTYGFKGLASLNAFNAPGEIDAVIIASNTEYHFEHIKWAVDQNPKVVLVEKPISSTVAQLNKVEGLLKATSIHMMANVIRNFDPLSLSLLSQITSTFNVTVTYSKALIHNGIHFLALLLKVYGDVTEINVEKYDVTKPTVLFSFPQGTARFQPCETDTKNELTVLSSDGRLNFKDGGRVVVIKRKNTPEIFLSNRLANYQENVIHQVVKCIHGAREDSFKLTVKAQRIIHKVLEQVPL